MHVYLDHMWSTHHAQEATRAYQGITGYMRYQHNMFLALLFWHEQTPEVN